MTAVTRVVPPHKIGATIGTIGTIWNIAGSLLLAISTAIFHTVEIKTSFLPAFHRTIDFNIAFATLALIAAIWLRSCIHINNTKI
ncbi:MAG: hypothetical protein LVR00_04775 [Rhabdochlamydiaceae bacterium]|jgi:hypothetical protein